ncbi:aldehyde ferredoxin oxidoreductase family protein, partial [Chloroflexota bacterium]
EETSPDTKWSDPENLLIFSPGCLVGTYSPGACRTSVDCISAFNNGKGSANFGGHWGAELKYAGFDHVVIAGKSATPVYLWIQDGKAEIRDASSIRGKLTDETEEILQRDLGDDKVSVASIGPAGENLVRGAAIFGDCGQAAGGSGVGCVMGDKNLKAVAVRGHGSIKIAKPERFFKAVEVAREKIEAAPLIKGEGGFNTFRHGIVVSYKYAEKPGAGPVRNAQDEFFPQERMDRLLSKDRGVPKYYTRMLACFDCPIGCQPFLEINEGKYKGAKGFTYWANSQAYSVRMDSDDPATSAKFQLMTNKLGMDGDTTVVLTAWAFECYEKGILTEEDTDGLELVWGNDDAWIKLVGKIARREGIGNLLAEGVLEASRKLGKGSEKLIAHCKGQDTIETFRVMPGWTLGVATSPVAGHHLRGAVSSPATSGPKPDVLPRTPDKPENQPEAVFWQLQTKEIEDATGTCVFMGSLSGAHALEPPDYAELINSALGIDLTPEEFMTLGQAGYNLEKAFNTIHTSFDRKDDYPPQRFIEEPIKTGPFAGKKAEKEVYDKMLDRFYELLDWDKTTSFQTAKGLAKLGLEEVAKKLEKAGKLK